MTVFDKNQSPWTAVIDSRLRHLLRCDAMELIENTICRDKIFDPFGRKNRLEISNVIDIYGLNWHLTNL